MSIRDALILEYIHLRRILRFECSNGTSDLETGVFLDVFFWLSIPATLRGSILDPWGAENVANSHIKVNELLQKYKVESDGLTRGGENHSRLHNLF